jgi:hypothetical protein
MRGRGRLLTAVNVGGQFTLPQICPKPVVDAAFYRNAAMIASLGLFRTLCKSFEFPIGLALKPAEFGAWPLCPPEE